MDDTILTTENVVNTDAKELASVPEQPKPLTRQEIGKLRRLYITIMHGTVRACGHKFDSKRQPKTNCEYCWEAYFMTAVDTAAIHDDLMKRGKKGLQSVYGNVFTKQFGKFLMAQLTQETETNVSEDHSVLPTGDRPEAGTDNESPYELGITE